jgi:hypothetical protein
VSTPDSLAAVRDQIRSLTEAAERLVRDVGARQPPPAAGWQESREPRELAGLVRLLELLGEILPPDIHGPLVELIRELLVLVRSLIDWAVARLEEPGRGREVEIEDIPIL